MFLLGPVASVRDHAKRDISQQIANIFVKVDYCYLYKALIRPKLRLLYVHLIL